MLTHDEELRLSRLARGGDGAAFDRIVLAHLPLVHSMAGQYRSHGVALDDLLGEAMLGLVKAARSFDPERGVRLAAYAAFWIRAYLRRFTLENRRIVRGPSTRNARRVIAGLRRAERELERVRGTHADADAVAEMLHVTTEEVNEIRSVLAARDVAVGDDANRHPELRSSGASPEALVSAAQREKLACELVNGALSRIEPRMRDVLARRSLGETSASLADIGKELRLSGERVRQIEARARGELKAAVSAALSARNISIDELSAA
jgi:RNA polymerase sigma-32 factor